MEFVVTKENDKRPKAESLYVSAAFNEDGSVSVLLVGKPKLRGGVPDIINAFEGPEANELWKKISEVKYTDK